MLARVRYRGLMMAIVIIIIAIVTTAMNAGTKGDDLYSKINRGLKTFGQVYKQVSLNYVDEIDPEVFVEEAINGMLGTLDPYTVFIKPGDGENYDMLTSGTYGGVGIRLGMRDDSLTVISPMEGTPAGRTGIRAGDKIIEIDGENTAKLKIDDAAKKIRGLAGTKVSLTFIRTGSAETFEYEFVREVIKINDVLFSDYAAPGIGYIRLIGFSRNADENFAEALKTFNTNQLKGIIIDLRDNPGGLLETALNVSDLFVEKGIPLVGTRGRQKKMNRDYKAQHDALIPKEIPIAVLVNGGSASASEIFAGVIQDLDRGVIIGRKTFGKGLVQTLFNMPAESRLKITTAKYYIPSGRFIQSDDYINEESNVVVSKESADQTFFTARGRKVYGHGGISPDIEIEVGSASRHVQELWRQGYFYQYAGYFTVKHPNAESPLIYSGEDWKEFENYLAENHFEYQNRSEEKFDQFLEALKTEGYTDNYIEQMTDLGNELHSMAPFEMEDDADLINRILSREISERISGTRGRYEALFQTDDAILRAIDILQNDVLYKQTLGYN